MVGPWRRVFASAAGAAAAAVVLVPMALRWLTNPEDQRLVDLDVYRTAAVALSRGEPLYGFLTEPPQLLPFTYPPFAAVLALPLAWMSWPVAQVVMVLLIYAALALAVWYGFRPLVARAGDWSPLVLGVLVALLLCPMPLRDQVRFGQVDLFLVALCVVDCATPRARWPRGLLVGLAMAIKLVPGVFLVYLLITRRREAAANALFTAAGATVFTFSLLPHDSLDFWFGALLEGDRVGSNYVTSNQAVRGFLLRLYWPDAVTVAVWAVAVAVLAWAGFRAARRLSLLGASGELSPGNSWSAEQAGVAVTGLVAVIIGPVSWIHHLAWIVLVIGALAGDGRNLRRCAVAAGVWLFYVLTIPWWGTSHIQAAHPLWEQAVGRIMQSSYGLGAVALLFVLGNWLVSEMWREESAVRRDESRVSGSMGMFTS